MKARTYWVGGSLLLVLLALLAGWYFRSTVVVWGFTDQDLLPLSPPLQGGAPARLTASFFAPWDQPDWVVGWEGPWGPTRQRPLVQSLSGTPPAELTAYQVFGLIAPPSQGALPDFVRWTADLDRKIPGVLPLALAGKSDQEFLNALLWFGDGVLGADQLASTFEQLSADPHLGIEASGTLAGGHPWAVVVRELRSWAALGRLAPNWWDYADGDVEAAVAQGTARWGLTWSDVHYAAADRGVASTVIRIPPAWPNRRSFSLLGRWLSVESGPGWGASAPRVAARERLNTAEVAQAWLRLRGLLMASPNLPAVNQESKALGLGLLSAGALVSAPLPSTDLTRWKPQLEALRAAVKQ